MQDISGLAAYPRPNKLGGICIFKKGSGDQGAVKLFYGSLVGIREVQIPSR